ncbi:MAG: FtsW/RodA/SpoVE family cell cycle protein [Paracoccaceae bacterium]
MTDIIFRSRSQLLEESELPMWWKTIDKWSLFSLLGLFLCGLLLGMAASIPLAESNGQDAFYYVKRQLFYGAVSFFTIIFLSILSIKENRRIFLIGFFLSLITLFLLPLIGTDHGKGAVRWISIFSISFQPSEFLKPFYIVAITWIMSSSYSNNQIPGKAISFIFMVIIVFILISQPDYGQAALFLSIWTILYFLAGASFLILSLIVLATLLIGFISYLNSSHFAGRINTFLNPEIEPRSQLDFALNAIQDGGLFGVGVGEGIIKWRLPDAHTDFIIAVAAEEYGIILCLLIILFFCLIIIRSLFLLKNQTNFFIRNCGVGAISFFSLQAIINLGVSVRLLPAKGMTLPFISYGGSSLIASGFLMGLLLACTRRRIEKIV